MMESGPAALLLNSLFQGQSKVLIVEEEGGAAAVVGEGVNGGFEGGCRSRGAIRTVFIDFKATVEVNEVVRKPLVVSRVGACWLTEKEPLQGSCCCGF